MAESPELRRFLGVTEPVWRVMVAGAVAGLWLLVAWTATAHANDCAQYVQDPRNFTGNIQGLIEDCMRTGYVQAIATLLVGGIGGGGIVIAVNKGLKGAGKDWKDPGVRPPPIEDSGPDHCGFCRAELPRGASICPACHKAKEACRNCGKKMWSAEKNFLCPTCSMAGVKDDSGTPEAGQEYCGWCRAPLPKGATLCPSCNKGKESCRNCGKKMWSAERDFLCPTCSIAGKKDDSGSPEAGPDHCGWCRAELPRGGTICPACGKSKEACRNCGKRMWSAEKNFLCPTCSIAGKKDDAGSPEAGPEFCGWCRAEIPKGASICPSCSKAKEACRVCGKKMWSAEKDFVCPTCSIAKSKADGAAVPAPPEPPDDEPDVPDEDSGEDSDQAPEEALSRPPRPDPTPEPEPQTFAKPKCIRCGHDLVGETADGRCPACGAPNPVSGGAPAGNTSGPADSPPVSNQGDSTGASSAGDSSTATPASTTSNAGPGGAPVTDPPFDQQGVVKGDKAADLLEQAGLAKVTRDSDGKVTRVEEAFPGAFTNLGGETVTMKGGEVPASGTDPAWREETKGKIIGIGFKPGSDGILEPVVVVNHGETKWEPVPPPTPDPITAALDAAKQKAAELAQQAADAAKAAEQQYQDLRGKLDKADIARGAYEGGKIFMSKAELDKQVKDLATALDVDPARALEILKMDNKTWNGLKAGVNLPGIFKGDKPI